MQGRPFHVSEPSPVADATGDYRVGWAAALCVLVVTGLLAVLRQDWTPPGGRPWPVSGRHRGC